MIYFFSSLASVASPSVVVSLLVPVELLLDPLSLPSFSLAIYMYEKTGNVPLFSLVCQCSYNNEYVFYCSKRAGQ